MHTVSSMYIMAYEHTRSRSMDWEALTVSYHHPMLNSISIPTIAKPSIQTELKSRDDRNGATRISDIYTRIL